MFGPDLGAGDRLQQGKTVESPSAGLGVELSKSEVLYMHPDRSRLVAANSVGGSSYYVLGITLRRSLPRWVAPWCSQEMLPSRVSPHR